MFTAFFIIFLFMSLSVYLCKSIPRRLEELLVLLELEFLANVNTWHEYWGSNSHPLLDRRNTLLLSHYFRRQYVFILELGSSRIHSKGTSNIKTSPQMRMRERWSGSLLSEGCFIKCHHILRCQKHCSELAR